MTQSQRIRPSSWLLREQLPSLSRLDTQKVAVAVAGWLDEPVSDTGEARFREVADLGFPCTEVIIRRGEKGIGLISAFVAQFNDGETVVLYIKEGQNFSLKDRNDIRAAFEEETRRRIDG